MEWTALAGIGGGSRFDSHRFRQPSVRSTMAEVWLFYGCEWSERSRTRQELLGFVKIPTRWADTARDGLRPCPASLEVLESWRMLRAEDQLDAVIDKGSPSAMTQAPLSRAVCTEPGAAVAPTK